MDANEYRFAFLPFPLHEGEVYIACMLFFVGDQPEIAETRRHVDLHLAVNQLLMTKTVRDQIFDRDDLHLEAPRELHELLGTRHRPMLVHDPNDNAPRLRSGKAWRAQ